jgi:hypothetical protein
VDIPRSTSSRECPAGARGVRQRHLDQHLTTTTQELHAPTSSAGDAPSDAGTPRSHRDEAEPVAAQRPGRSRRWSARRAVLPDRHAGCDGPTVLATKAARCVTASRGRAIVEFGLGRTPGIDAGMTTAAHKAVQVTKEMDARGQRLAACASTAVTFGAPPHCPRHVPRPVQRPLARRSTDAQGRRRGA